MENQKERFALENLLDQYLTQAKKDLKDGVNFREASTTVFVIAEAYHLLPNKTEMDELIYQNMICMKECILENKLYCNPSLYDGLAEIALSTYAVCKSTGYYKRFLGTINRLLLKWIRSFLDSIDVKENLRVENYDAILGISGIAKYLPLINDQEEYTDVIQELLKILVYISGYNKQGEFLIPRWYIENKNLIMERDQKMFPTGCLNFGLAHGIAAPLEILSEAYEKGILVDGQLNAIKSIVNEYKRLAYTVNGSVYWTGLLSPESYLSGANVSNKSASRESWCYGAISIAKVLMTAGYCIQDDHLKDWAYGIITQKAQLKIEDYMLDSPILCHGYAGVLSILISTYNVLPSLELKQGIDKVEQQLIQMYDKDSKYGFYDIENKFENGQNKKIKVDRNTFIDGAGGVILALLSAEGHGSNIFMKKLLIE